MALLPESRRRYSEEEMKVILEIASQLEAQSPGQSARNYTLDEIEQIASEAGIDSQVIRHAAAMLAERPPSLLQRVGGAPVSFNIERSVAGEVSSEELLELISTVRRVVGHEGETKSVARSIEWQHKGEESGSTHVQITPRNGVTRIRITGHYADRAHWSYIAGGLLAIVGSAGAVSVIGPPLLEVGAIGAIIAGSYAAARTLWTGISRHAERLLERLANELASQAGEAIGSETRGSEDALLGPAAAPSRETRTPQSRD